MVSIEILPEKNVIDDGLLALIGREFATHEQGLAEWLKNAVDATQAAGLGPGLDTIFLRLTDGQESMPPVFECIDFVGMTLEDIESGFKPWGKLSQPGVRSQAYGGYGIGGKFYMRQMFGSSYLITYRQGLVNIFGFDPNHAYGYAQGFRNRPMNPQETLRFAGIEPLAEIAGVKREVISGTRGFSVFRGLGPRGIGKTVDLADLCNRLKHQPQAQRPLRSQRVCVIHNGAVAVERLKPQSIPRKPGFEQPWVRKIPFVIQPVDGTKGAVVRLSKNSESPGTLRLSLSDRPLARTGKMASLNRIDFIGEDDVMASYRIDELGVDVPYGESIFGQCTLTQRGFFEENPGKKNRDKLVESPETRALLQWVGSQVTLFSEMIRRRASISGGAQKE